MIAVPYFKVFTTEIGQKPLLWLCRTILLTDARNLLSKDKHRSRSEICHFFDIQEEASSQEIEQTVQAVMDSIVASREEDNSPFFQNLYLLGKRLGLMPVDSNVIALRALIRLDNTFFELLVNGLGELNDWRLCNLLSIILDEPFREVERTLDEGGRLRTSGLIYWDQAIGTFRDRLAFPSGFINALTRRNRTIDDFLSFIVRRVMPSTLNRNDFDYLHAELDLIVHYLKCVRKKKRKGVNILFYGNPGVGKTALASVIAKELGWKLFEVGSTQSDDSFEWTVDNRLHVLMLVNRLFANTHNTVILFDEVEDVFPPQSLTTSRFQGQQSKISLNRRIEVNSVPTIWVTNRIDHMDEAYLRRFDLVIRIEDPPTAVKRQIMEATAAGVEFNPGWADMHMTRRGMTPGVVERITRVVAESGSHEPQDFMEKFDLVSSHYLRASGYGVMQNIGSNKQLDYDLEVVNASCDPSSLAKNLARVGSGRFLFHGLPGTGKTAYAKQLAKQIDRPLLLRKASDILAKFVGETEQNLREMFEQARHDNAVLLLDEADSFLQARTGAQRSWELTQVNELLTQMEVFEGTFICTTNLLDQLDPAAMRRFDVKVEFLPIKPEQRMRMFKIACAQCDIQPSEKDLHQVISVLDSMSTLTPGDFATAVRKLRLTLERATVSALVHALKEELQYKPSAPRQIGFMAQPVPMI